jgi:hypothetical protein|tara:strand:+ start:666 stop:908 length:243 start_codon:yes stop_codon:yes gene_type:complete
MVLPRPQENLEEWGNQLVDELENEIEKINQAANTGTATDSFAPSNFTQTKSLNAGTANTAAVANVLCTVIEALRNKGILA